MTLNLDDLERTANAATQGKWWWERTNALGEVPCHTMHGPIVLCRWWEANGMDASNDAKHIAKFDPPTCLELIAEVRRLEAQIAGYRERYEGRL